MIFLNVIHLEGQTINPCAPIGEDLCVDAPLINSCQLNGWRSDTDPPDQTFTWNDDVPRRGWCIENGFQYTIENNQWMSFVAEEDHMYLEVDISECDANRGIQLGCYELRAEDGDCPGQMIACKGARSGENTNFIFYMEPLIPGETYLIMIDGYGGDGCPFTLWIESGVEITANAVASGLTVCPGVEAVGALSALGSDSGPGFIYGWETENGNIVSGHYTLTPIIDEPGDYTFTVYDLESCCWASVTVTVEETTEFPEAIASVDRPIGCDGSSVTLSGEGSTLDTSGGSIPDYLYGWIDEEGNFVSTDFEFTGVTEAGNYTFVVIDRRNGCRAETSIEVVIDTIPPVINPYTEGIIDCNNQTASIFSNVDASIDSIEWIGPDGTIYSDSNFVVSSPGTYDVVVTGINGCTNQFTVDIDSDLGIPDLSAEGAMLDCNIQSAQIEASSIDAIAFEWTGPNGFISSETNPMINEAGTYTVVATGMNGCTEMMMVEVEEDLTEPEAESIVDGILDCNILDVSLTGSSSTIDATYSWTGPGGFSSNSETAVVNEAGEYILIVTGPNGCTQETTIEVEQDLSPPDVEILPVATLTCDLQDVNLTGNSSTTDATFEWQGFGTPGADATVSEPGEYSFIVTGPNGCTADASIIVEQDINPPLANAGPDNLITCQETAADLDGSASDAGANITYQWLSAGGTEIGTDMNLTINNPGTYNLVVTNLDNGCTSIDEVVINADESLPVADAGPEAFITCINSMVQLDGSNSSTGPTITYQWQDENGNHLGQGALLETADPGTYTLIISDSSNGCVTESQVEVTEDVEDPEALIGPGEILNCDNTVLDLDGSGSTGADNLQFNWTSSMGMPLGFENSISVSEAGTYTLEVSNPENGCTSITEIVITEDFNDPIADPGQPFLITCTESEGVLDGSSSSGVDLSYEWLDENGTVVSNDAMVSTEVSGTYTLNITDLSNGCTDFAEIVIEEDTDYPISDPGIADELDCNVLEVALDASNSSSGANMIYQWLDENGNEVGSDINLTVEEAGSYELVVTNTDNSCSSSSIIEVSENIESPLADAGQPLIITCDVTEVMLNGSQSSSGSNIVYEWQNANGVVVGNTANLQVSNPDTYILIVENTSNGCTAMSEVAVTPDENIPLSSVSASGNLNCDVSEVELNNQGSDFGLNISQQWFDADGNSIGSDNSFMVSAPGVYTLQVVDQDNGCSSEASILVEQNIDPPVADPGLEQILNCEINTVVLDASGSLASINSDFDNLIFAWQDDATGFMVGSEVEFQTSTAGTYNLLITDLSNGCTSIASVAVIDEVDVPFADAGANGLLTCEDNSYLLGSTATSTGQDISYEWLDMNGDVLSTEMQYETTEAGSYTLVVTNNRSACVESATVIVDQDADFPQADAGPPQTITCRESIHVIGGQNTDQGSNIIYEWRDETGNIIGQESELEVNQIGVYELVVINLENGCTAISSVEIDEDINAPSAQIDEPFLLTCNQPSFSLIANSDLAMATFEWTAAQSTIIGTESSLMVDQDGLYTLVVTNPENGCTTISSVEVEANFEEPNLELSDINQLTCVVNNISIDASASSGIGNLMYEWSDPNGNLISDQSSIDVEEVGTFQLTITDEFNGCTQEISFPVLEDIQDPLAAIGNLDIITCLNPMEELSAEGSTEGANMVYQWTDSSGNVVSNEYSFTTDVVGEYNLLVTDMQNGCTSTSTANLTENLADPEAIIDIVGPLVIDCLNDKVILNGSNSIPFPSLTFEWFDENGNLISNNFETEVLASGNYTMVVTDQVNGCIHESAIIVVDNFDLPQVNIAPPELITCYTPSIELNAVGSSEGDEFVYQWNSPTGGQLSNTEILNPEVNEAGTYELTIFNTLNGCEQTLEVEVDLDQTPPEVETAVNDALDCVTEFVDLFGDGSSIGSEFQYEWTGPQQIQNASNLNVTVATAGTYELLITNTENGCSSLKRIEVEENLEQPSDAIIDYKDITCFGFNDGQIEISDIVGGTAPYMYSFNGSSYSGDISFNNLAPGTYPIQVIDAIGCEWETELLIVEPPQVYVDLGPDLEINLGDVVDLNALTNGTFIEWESEDDLDCLDNCFTQTVSPFVNTTYYVEVTDENGCPDIDEIVLKVDRTRAVYIPNVFSPNKDGINDFFTVYNNPTITKVNRMLIADRWGEIVFEARDFIPEDPANGWYGDFRGEEMNVGVFVYYAEVEFIDGFVGKYKGDVTLMY